MTEGRRRKGSTLSTSDDVARLAGVSTATVSRYLNHPDVVAKATAEKVRGAIAQLGYVPNADAGSLASRSSRFIAILVPHFANSIIEKTIERLVERLSAGGSIPFIALTSMEDERNREVILAALQRRAEAIILTGPVPDSLRPLLEKSSTTCIEIWGQPTNPVEVAIGFSHREIGAALAEFAHRKGYRRPHLVTGSGVRAGRRHDAFRKRWTDLGHDEPTETQVSIPLHYGQAPEVFAAMEKMPERPDVVVTGSDYLAHGLIALAQQNGLNVPDELAVVGFGDLEVGSLVTPSITTVRIDGTRIADEALAVIFEKRNGRDPAQRWVDCGFEIVARQSA